MKKNIVYNRYDLIRFKLPRNDNIINSMLKTELFSQGKELLEEKLINSAKNRNESLDSFLYNLAYGIGNIDDDFESYKNKWKLTNFSETESSSCHKCGKYVNSIIPIDSVGRVDSLCMNCLLEEIPYMKNGINDAYSSKNNIERICNINEFSKKEHIDSLKRILGNNAHISNIEFNKRFTRGFE